MKSTVTKGKILIVYIIIFNSLITLAQTPNLSLHITTDTTWAADTLEIIGNVLIDSNVTLTVMPGAFIHILGYYSITSYGTIKAIGTATDSITFTHLDTYLHNDTSTTAGGWHGIRLLPRSSPDTSFFKYCKITNGKAVVPGSWIPDWDKPENMGGNIFGHDFGNLVIKNSYIGNGRVKSDGGGIYLKKGAYVSVVNNHFEFNHAYGVHGGGACIRDVDSLYVRNNLFNHNTAYYNLPGYSAGGTGGGIAVLFGIGYSAYALIENNRFFNNKTGSGVIYESYYNVDIVGNLICNNYGVGIYNGHGFNHPFYSNNTIVNNLTGFLAGALTINSNYVTLLNNIFRSNYFMPNYLTEQIHLTILVTTPPTVNFCNVQLGFEGEGNIDADALFVNPTESHGLEYDGLLADWSLQDNSPCINSGTPDTTGLFLPDLDLAGNPRIFGNRIDMGAYENQHVWVKINDSPAFANQTKVYPNPGTDRIMVQLPENTQEAWIELLDGTGQRVVLERVYSNLCLFTPTHLPSGIYFYRIYNRDQVFKKGKWVKK